MRTRAAVATISSLLHMPAMVGYNRYSVSLSRELARVADRPITWIPLPAGVHPALESQLPGTVAPPVGYNPLTGGYHWMRADRQIRPALWHVHTDLPVPFAVRGPVVVTCHGLPRWLRHTHMIRDGLLPGGFWDYQDVPVGWGVRRAMAAEWLATRLSLWRADAIITDSAYGKWELMNKFGIREEKVTVVHLAPDPTFLRTRGPDEVDRVRRKYALPPRFALGVASFSRTKNTQGLLRLARGLTATTGLPPMVLVGPAGASDRFDLDGLVVGRDLFLLHNIPDDDLACLYRAADVFVNLAWEETFGLPIVEAMASGTAVVGNTRTAVPEVIGEGGLTVDASDEEAVVRTVREVLVRTELRERLRAQAVRRAADFSWERAAKETSAVYERVLARKGR